MIYGVDDFIRHFVLPDGERSRILSISPYAAILLRRPPALYWRAFNFSLTSPEVSPSGDVRNNSSICWVEIGMFGDFMWRRGLLVRTLPTLWVQ